MSGTITGIQEIEKPESEEGVNFDEPRDKDESKKLFDEKNVIPEPVSQPYVTLKSDVLRSILASLKDASVKSQTDSQPKNESQDAATLLTLQKGHNNCEVQDEIMKEANSVEGSKEEERSHQRLVSQYLDSKKNAEPHLLAEESQEEKIERERTILNLRIMSVDSNSTRARKGERKSNSSGQGHLRYLLSPLKLKFT